MGKGRERVRGRSEREFREEETENGEEGEMVVGVREREGWDGNNRSADRKRRREGGRMERGRKRRED